MPPLEDWFNIVAMCLDAMCLEAPVKMIIAQTAGYRVAIGPAGVHSAAHFPNAWGKAVWVRARNKEATR